MIFELPFDPILIFRIHTVAHAPRPWALVYPPLLLVEITTLLLRLTRATFFSFALMLGVWAAWAAGAAGSRHPAWQTLVCHGPLRQTNGTPEAQWGWTRSTTGARGLAVSTGGVTVVSKGQVVAP